MFEAIIQETQDSGQPLSLPESFRNYCIRTGHPIPRDVPARVAVQTLRSLHRDLYDSNYMIFRLGTPPNETHTHFGIAMTANGWSDYFLIDKDIFSESEVQAFIPKASYRDLYSFTLMPKFTETTMVNFALASGLFTEALGLDESPSIPVTGRGTYTFSFHPRLESDAIWSHHLGQVEIDGAFTARRNGRDCLFIVEAKHGEPDSLSKTKLLYPYLALRPQVPISMPIILVYLRATSEAGAITYRIVECSTPSEDVPSPLNMLPHSPRILTVTRPSS